MEPKLDSLGAVGLVRTGARRLLLIPAVLLVLTGAPALALDGSTAAPPATDAVPLALPESAGPGAQATTSTPADLVGVTWRGDPDTEFAIEVKRAGSDRWEPAATLGGDDIGADAGTAEARGALRTRDGANATEPVWVEDSAAVRVTVVSGTADDVTVEAVTSDADRAPGGSAGALGLSFPDTPDRYGFAIALVVGGLVLGAVALGWSPWRSRRLLALGGVVSLVALAACVPPPPPPEAPTAIATKTPQPTITMRSSWGPDLAWNPSEDCAPGPEYAQDVAFVVVHHTVNSNAYGPSDSRAMVRAIWSYHVNTLGYCDIAYNFVIDKYGQIFEGRQGGITRPVIAAHTGGWNRSSTGIALLGNMSEAAPTNAEWNSLVELTAWKLSVHMKNPSDGFLGIAGTFDGGGVKYPSGTFVNFPSRIVGHQDMMYTECPGTQMYPRLGDLRAAVQPKIGWTAPGSTTTTTTTAPSTTSTSQAGVSARSAPVVTTVPPTSAPPASTVPTTVPAGSPTTTTTTAAAP